MTKTSSKFFSHVFLFKIYSLTTTKRKEKKKKSKQKGNFWESLYNCNVALNHFSITFLSKNHSDFPLF